MTYKQIETSREIRQWIRIVMGVIGVGLYFDYLHPEVKYNLINKFKKEKKND